jgi:hypothetical protein
MPYRAPMTSLQGFGGGVVDEGMHAAREDGGVIGGV